MNEYSCTVWWWSDPNHRWLPKILNQIKSSSPPDKDIIILHCEDVTDFGESIPIVNYFYNLFLILNSVGDERTMFLNLKDMISSIELYLTRQKKKNVLSDVDILDDEITQFYDKYINSYEKKNNDCEDESIILFKEFLKLNNCIDVRLLLDFYVENDKSDISGNLNGHSYLILGTPSSPILKQFIGILSGQTICSICVETPLDISLQGTPNSHLLEKIKILAEHIEITDVTVSSEKTLDFASATEEYVEDIIISFLSLLVNSRNELALSKVMVSPIINLSHDAFTALKHLSVEKEMPMCQVAVSYVTRIRLGGKGYAPTSDCPMLPHLKGLELFVDTLNQMQTVIEEDSCPSSAIKRLINILKKKLLKCGNEKLKNSAVVAIAESLQSTLLTITEILKSRMSCNASQICQGALDSLYHFVNFLNCNYFIYDPEIILSKKKVKRTPLNLPPLLGYFRSPDEESNCDTKSSLNEDSVLSRNSEVQTPAFSSYFHHSESSEISLSCVNSSTPSKITFKGCLKEKEESKAHIQKKAVEFFSENFQDNVPPKKNRKRCILSEITNESISVNKNETHNKNDGEKTNKISLNSKENTVVLINKRQSKKEPKRSAKKFKQIQGQGKITSFFCGKQR